MGCVRQLSELLDSLPGVDHGEFVTPSRVIRFVRHPAGAVAVDFVPGTDLMAVLDSVMPLGGSTTEPAVAATAGARVQENGR